MIASRSMNIAAAVATVAAVSVAMARPAHGAGIASSDRPAALDIATPGRDAAAGDALRHAHKYERPSASFSSFRPHGSGLRPARGQSPRSEEPEPRALAEFLGFRFRGNDDQDPGIEMCACRSAKAGAQGLPHVAHHWVPAFAGMTTQRIGAPHQHHCEERSDEAI
jgi:hypothetical protein